MECGLRFTITFWLVVLAGPVALRILGKLGGRNRNCIRSPLELTCKENPENGLRLVLTFEPGMPLGQSSPR